MRIVTISDTHGQHHSLELPKGDMLLHAGDVSKFGAEAQILDFLAWFSSLDFAYKIFIAGNHDYFFERNDIRYIKELIPENIIYLNDSGITINGLNIWGSPVQPWFFDWAFNRKRGEEIAKHWGLIPENTDVLLVHGPVYGHLDIVDRNDEHVGCEDLRIKVDAIKPKVVVCGHIHEAYGVKINNDICYINASVLNLGYELVNAPIVIEVKEDKTIEILSE